MSRKRRKKRRKGKSRKSLSRRLGRGLIKTARAQQRTARIWNKVAGVPKTEVEESGTKRRLDSLYDDQDLLGEEEGEEEMRADEDIIEDDVDWRLR